MFRMLSLLFVVLIMGLMWVMVAERAVPGPRACPDGSSTTTLVSVPRELQALVARCS